MTNEEKTDFLLIRELNETSYHTTPCGVTSSSCSYIYMYGLREYIMIYDYCANLVDVATIFGSGLMSCRIITELSQ